MAAKAIPLVVLSLLLLLPPPMAIASTDTEIIPVSITIPEYTVTHVGSLDYISIESGQTLMVEEGRPQVPYLTHTIDLVMGQQVQEVRLVSKDGLIADSGLNLPVVNLDDYATVAPPLLSGWYPDEGFSYGVTRYADGTSQLNIAVYPFAYEPESKESLFYSEFAFEVTVVNSLVSLTNLSTEKDTYYQDDEVVLNVNLTNNTDSQDLVLAAALRQYGTDDLIASLPLHQLKDFSGQGSLSFTLATQDLEIGYYYFEVIIYDASSWILDRATAELVLTTPGASQPTTTLPTTTGSESTSTTTSTPFDISKPIFLYIGIAIVAVLVLIVMFVIIQKRKRS